MPSVRTTCILSHIIKTVIRELSFITRRGGRLFVGGPEFFGIVQGGDQNFFSGSKGGTKIF